MPPIPKSVASLPSPYQFFRFISGSDHLHFGLVSADDHDETPQTSQDRMSTCLADRLPEATRRVLDVGCGLGGTARLLARRGKFVVGICPDDALIEYGKGINVDEGLDGNIYLETARFQDYPLTVGDPFDVAFTLESLQYLSGLESTFQHMASLVTKDGYLAIADQVTRDPALKKLARFHTADEIRAAAAATSWRLLDHEDVTEQAMPTVSRALKLLREKREEIIEFFVADQPNVAEELEVCINLGDLERKHYESGAIGYEVFLYQRDPA